MSTVAVELPEDWDALMEEKGYEPLRTFFLEPINDEFYDPLTSVEEVKVAPAESSKPTSVRYYDLNGFEKSRPIDQGISIEVTTNSDNTRSAKKVLRMN